SKDANPGRKHAPREREGLFDIVSWTEMRCCLHPEERACASASAKSNARARASKDEDVRLGSPSCFETHRSAAEAEGVCASICAAMLLSMRARAKHQLAAVRNDRRGTFIASGLLFTMTFATPTCRPHRALKIVQGHTRADVPPKPPSHSNRSSIARCF